MSDPRLESAKEALSKGAYEQVIQALKPLLGEIPDDMEIRSLLTEAQEGMMLRLQLSRKVKKAEELLAGKNFEAAKKTVADILKIDPANPDALQLKRVLDAPASRDPGATIAFEMDEPIFDEQGPAEKAAAPDGLESLEPFNLPMEDFQGSPDELSAESTKISSGSFSTEENPIFSADYSESAPAAGGTIEENGLEDNVAGFGAESPAPFSLGGEGGKVGAFITEGKRLTSEGKYQEAIDILTRVFILDEENQEAQKLIDEAKELDLNREREINVILNEAMSAYDLKELEKAKSLFNKVLAAFPGHREADYYLKEIEKQENPESGFELETPGSSGFELEDGGDSSFVFESSSGASTDDLASLVEKQPAAAPTVSGKFPAASVAKKLEPGKNVPYGLVAIIIGALILVSALFFVVPMLWRQFFSPVPKAQSIPVKPVKKTASADTKKPPLPAVPLELRKSFADIVAEAKKAMEEKQFEKAVKLYTTAANMDKADLNVRMALESAKMHWSEQQAELVKVQKFITDYEKATQYFKTQEYGEAIRISWRLIYPKDQEVFAVKMGKADLIKKIIRNGYYNWGVKDLKTGHPLSAKKNLQDLMDFAPTDSKGRELLDFSKKYTKTPTDDYYESYVQELSYRSIED